MDRPLAAARPPTTTTMRPDDWDGRDLTSQRFEAVAFAGVDLAEQHEHGAAFVDCTFRGVRFNAGEHRDAAFLNATFIDCSFFDVRFIGCKLVGSAFERCSFGPLVVEGGDWSLVSLAGADLRQAEFRNVRMAETDLSGARLDGAVLRDCGLAGAWLRGANLHGTDLRGSDLTSLDPLDADVGEARIDVEQALVIATALGLRIG